MRERKPCPNQGWEQLSTEELDSILQAELRKEHPDEEVVLPILRLLEEREKDIRVEQTPEILAISEKLNEHETLSKHSDRKRRWITGIAAAAAVAVIVVMAMPRTVGAESLFDVLVRWTSSIFEFVDPDKDENSSNINNEFATDHPGLQELYDKVTELGVEADVVPTWLPEGFVLTELKEFPVFGGCKLHARFNNGTKGISITYRITTDVTAKFEKEETVVEVMDAGGESHFIMENDESLSVTWSVDNVDGSILADVHKEDLYLIIKSIYRSELSQ